MLELERKVQHSKKNYLFGKDRRVRRVLGFLRLG